MNERGLKYFLAVIRLGSIRAASEALNVAPSAISRQVAELETGLQTQLLDRLPRGVAPTEAGKLVAEYAQRQADEETGLFDQLRQLRGLQQGTVKICCGAGFLPDLIENALASFTQAFPGIRYQITLGTTNTILTAIATGEVDIGLAYNPIAHPDVRAVVIARQPIVAILPPDHAMAHSQRPETLSRFASETAILLPPDHGIRQLLGRTEANGGFRLVTRMESASFEAHRHFVTAGMGVAFLPEFTVFAELREGRVAALKLVDPILAEATAHLLVCSHRRLPAATEKLTSWLAQTLVSLRQL